MDRKEMLDGLKDFAVHIGKSLKKPVCWILAFAAIFAFIAGFNYYMWEYAIPAESIWFWLYLAVVILTPIALFVGYRKTGNKILYKAKKLGAWAVIPATVIGCAHAIPNSSADIHDGPIPMDMDYTMPWKTQYDLTKISGVEFPEVELVDSNAYVYDGF